jgi:hypothetical protein
MDNKENKMTHKEKCEYLWDYYKDSFGHRPRHFLADFWVNEEQVDAAIKRCDNWFETMKSTRAGRDELREMGWHIEGLE